jgi:ABC-type transporter Mla MlaB component
MADRSVQRMERAGVSIVAVHGTLDSDRSDLWSLLADVRGPVVIDCARIQGADPGGLSTLAEFRSTSTALVLRRVPAPLRLLLEEHELEDLVAYAEREAGRR